MTSNKDLVSWYNANFSAGIAKLENLSTGVAYCKLIHSINPQILPLPRIKQKTITSNDNLHNFKLLQQSLDKMGCSKYMNVQKLTAGTLQDHLDLSAFLKKLFEKNKPETSNKENDQAQSNKLQESDTQQNQQNEEHNPLKELLDKYSLNQDQLEDILIKHQEIKNTLLDLNLDNEQIVWRTRQILGIEIKYPTQSEIQKQSIQKSQQSIIEEVQQQKSVEDCDDLMKPIEEIAQIPDASSSKNSNIFFFNQPSELINRRDSVFTETNYPLSVRQSCYTNEQQQLIQQQQNYMNQQQNPNNMWQNLNQEAGDLNQFIQDPKKSVAKQNELNQFILQDEEQSQFFIEQPNEQNQQFSIQKQKIMNNDFQPDQEDYFKSEFKDKNQFSVRAQIGSENKWNVSNQKQPNAKPTNNHNPIHFYSHQNERYAYKSLKPKNFFSVNVAKQNHFNKRNSTSGMQIEH